MKSTLALTLLTAHLAVMAQTQPLTVLPLQPTPFPLSFCGQYPQHEVCKKKEEIVTKCIDGFLYRRGKNPKGHAIWIPLVDANDQPRECKVCMLPEGCAKKE